MKKSKKEIQKECDHIFQSDGKNPYYEIRGLGETLEKKIVCKKCGLKAREVWIYSCTMTDDNEQV